MVIGMSVSNVPVCITKNGEQTIKNDGKEHRTLAKGANMASWLRRNGYPGGIQVLCFNCNLGKSINKGICPHKEIILNKK